MFQGRAGAEDGGRMITREGYAACAEALAPAMKRVAMSILRAGCDADDAVQQALENVWEKRESVDEARLNGYLMRVVVNECRNIQRKRMRVFPVAELPEGAYEPPESRLREAIDALPETLRTPLLLHYMEGYPEREICRILSLSAPQLKSRLFRARRKLRRAIETEGMES